MVFTVTPICGGDATRDTLIGDDTRAGAAVGITRAAAGITSTTNMVASFIRAWGREVTLRALGVGAEPEGIRSEGPGSEPGNSLLCPDEAACSVCGVLGIVQCCARRWRLAGAKTVV